MSDMTLYQCNCDRRKVYKATSLVPVQDITETFRLKEPTSVIHPTVIVSRETVGKNWAVANYAYIPMFKRYYFIDNITALNGGLIQYDMTVDPLYTYASKEQGFSLLKTAFEIARSESLNSKYYIDPELYLQTYRTIEPVIVGNIPQTSASSAKKYVITVAGGT